MDGKYEKIVDNVKEMGRCPKPRRSPRGRPADSSPVVAGVFRLAPGDRVISLQSCCHQSHLGRASPAGRVRASPGESGEISPGRVQPGESGRVGRDLARASPSSIL